jgi:uncharacterized protein YjbI with pentapeptide repeats
MLAAVVAVVIVTFVVTTWLLAIASQAHSGTALANARLDAVRTGLAAGAGAGAAVGLMLAFRRQHHQEVETVLTDIDATERRITELYTKAVEQLGNDKAPVRLGGLYALERLAQDNPAHRQTIVNVICAYLRMPFPPTGPTSKPKPEGTEQKEAPAAETQPGIVALSDTWQQERQVRLTAQSILTDHLSINKAAPFWPDLRVDLSGATLIDFSFSKARVAEAWFTGATFSGTTYFYEAVFNGTAWFHGANFLDDVAFSLATFRGITDFGEATFASHVWFGQTIFEADTKFDDATFGGPTTFNHATFGGLAEFQPASFTGHTDFYNVAFGGCAWFNMTTFADFVGFNGATFADDASFHGVTFGGRTEFDGATFADGADRLPFARTLVLSPDAQHVWPTGWCLGPKAKAGYLVIRAKKDSHSVT